MSDYIQLPDTEVIYGPLPEVVEIEPCYHCRNDLSQNYTHYLTEGKRFCSNNCFMVYFVNRELMKIHDNLFAVGQDKVDF